MSCCSDVMKPIEAASCCTPKDTAAHAARAMRTSRRKLHELRPGGVLALDHGVLHDVEALEESAFLFTIAWPQGKLTVQMGEMKGDRHYPLHSSRDWTTLPRGLRRSRRFREEVPLTCEGG